MNSTIEDFRKASRGPLEEFIDYLGIDEKTAGIIANELKKRAIESEHYLNNPALAAAIYEDGIKTLSDEACKLIQRKLDNGEELNEDDVSFMANMAGPIDGANYEDDENDWEEGMLEEYARHLRNYKYTYKKEAESIDPRIDHNEEHRGPMAQHIEQVAPDCVKETPEGVKTVDGNRLALVNAGVIGSLARRLLKLENAVNFGGAA